MDACLKQSNGSQSNGRSRQECIGTGQMQSEKKAKRGEKDVEKLRRLFDRIVLILYVDSGGGGGSSDGNIAPLQPMLIDGTRVDLFRLFEAVAARGGHKRVSRQGLWGKVTDELGVDRALKKSLIQIYVKYLSELDKRALSIIQFRKPGDQESGIGKNTNLVKVVDSGSRGISLNGNQVVKEEGRSRSKNGEGFTQHQPGRSDLQSHINSFARKLLLHRKTTHGSVKKKATRYNDEKLVCLETVVGSSGFSSQKRKPVTMASLLKWVTRTARHPVRSAAEVKHTRKEYFEQSIFLRKELFIKLSTPGNDQAELQNQMKMQPFMYDDDNASFSGKSLGILRSSKRVSSKKQISIKERPDKLPNTGDINAKSFALCIQFDAENLDPYKPDRAASVPKTSWYEGLPIERHLSVGSDYQTDVPEWAGVVTESDPKWLGTRVWPLNNEQNNALVPVSLGVSCSCKLPGSITCTRFHIAEKRLVLKRELGSVFYLWKFDQMGEEISLRWTGIEENRFMEMVRENPPAADKCFWDVASKYLPKKTKNMLVSYYFNVFVLRRRSYQNRVTPTDIDSDDDDKQFESLGGRYGQEATTIPYSNSFNCTHNEQCMELD